MHRSISEMHRIKQQSKKKKKKHIFFSAPTEQEVIQLKILVYFQSMSNLADSIISNSHKFHMPVAILAYERKWD